MQLSENGAQRFTFWASTTAKGGQVYGSRMRIIWFGWEVWNGYRMTPTI